LALPPSGITAGKKTDANAFDQSGCRVFCPAPLRTAGRFFPRVFDAKENPSRARGLSNEAQDKILQKAKKGFKTTWKYIGRMNTVSPKKSIARFVTLALRGTSGERA
jgi:hypothetical protein